MAGQTAGSFSGTLTSPAVPTESQDRDALISEPAV